MSNAIDQRIVEMSFENHKFEKGISQSNKSLKNFADSLDGLSKGRDFKGLESSLKSTTNSFSALEQVAIGSLRRIGEAAVNAGANVFKSLAIAPINQGFNEMELKMNSTQTIMASTGEALAVVNSYLAELNEYSDRTIYSFANMTQNIGKFTNAGVKLETAVASIKGISNAAALSGANSEEAARAMYNFAQALSAGYVKLVDWKSIELANMATVEFKNQLLESAVAAGTVAKTADGMYQVLTSDMSGSKMEQTISATKNFNESLSFQWMTTDALTKTLSNYADETTDIGKRAMKAATQVTTLTKMMDTLKESVGSGWAQTFEIIFGDFNEARDLWSGMNDVIGGTINSISDMRNAMLMNSLGSGWKQFMKQGISDTATFGDTLAEVARDAGINIDDIITKTGSMEKAVKENWVTGEMLVETVSRMSKSVENLSLEELRNTGYTEKNRTELLALRDALLSGSISADEFAKKMSRMSGRENIIQGLKNTVVALLTAIRPISKAFDQIFPPKTAESWYNMTEAFKNFTKGLILSEETTKKIQRTFAGFFAVVDIGWQTVKFLGKSLLEIIGIFVPINGGILEMTGSIGDFLVLLNHLIKRTGIFEYGLLGVKIAAAIIRDVFTGLVGNITEFVRVLWTTDRPLEYLGKTITGVFTGIIDILQAGVGLISDKFLGALEAVQKFFDTKLGDGSGALGGILEIFTDFIGFIVGEGAGGIVNFGDALKKLDFSKIVTFVTGGVILLFVGQLTKLTSTTSNLVKTADTFLGKFSKKLFGTHTKIKDLAISFGILAGSLYLLSTIPWENLIRGLVGLASAMLIFVGAYAAIQAITVISSKKMNGVESVKSAMSLMSLAGGLAIMAIAVTKISKIDKDQVWTAVGVVGAMIGLLAAYHALTVAINLIPGQKASAKGVRNMSAGLLGLVGVIVILDLLPMSSIKDGLAKIAGIMIALAAVQALFNAASRLTGGNKVAINVGMITLGLLGMIAVIGVSSLLSARTISQGIGNVLLIGGVLAAIQAMFNIAGRIGKGLVFKTHILAMQVGLMSMISLVAILGIMDQTKIQNGIKNLTKMSLIIAGLEVITALAARISGQNKLQKIFASISLTMLSFTMIIGILGAYKESTINKGLKTILKMTGIIMAIELMTALIGKIEMKGKGAGVLMAVVAMLLAITGALALLSMIDQDALRQAAVSLSVAVVSIGVMAIGMSAILKSLSTMSSGLGGIKAMAKNILPGFVILGTMILGALAFFAVVKMVESSLDVSWDSLGKFIFGLGVVTALTLAFTVLTKIPGIGGGFKALLGLLPGFAAMALLVASTAGLFVLIGSVLGTVDRISWSSFNKFMIGLDVISDLVVKMTLLGPLFMLLGAGFLYAIGGVLTAIASVGAVIFAFVGLAAALEAIFASDPDFLIQGIDKLVLVGEGLGRFIGALAGGVTSELMIAYGEGLAGFADAVSTIKTDSFVGIESLAKAIMALTAASFLEGLTKLITLDFGKNSGELFGEQIQGIITSLNKISILDASHTTDILAVLAPMAENLAKLANAAKEIPNSGWVAGLVMGNNDIDDFGERLKDLVDLFSNVAEGEVSHVVSILETMEPMAHSIKSLAKAADKIPNSGWLAALVMGNNDIDDFGDRLVDLLDVFSPFDVGTVTQATAVLDTMTPMADSLEEFAKAAEKIPNSGWIAGLFAGNNDIDDFGKKIGKLVSTFAKINQGDAKAANDTLGIMSEHLLPGLEKLIKLFKKLNNIEVESAPFTDLAIDLESFVKILKRVDVSVVGPAIASMADITESFQILGKDVIESAKASFDNNKIPFQASIVSLLTDTAKIVTDNAGLISQSFAEIFDTVLLDSKAYIDDFTTLGVNIVKGLKIGIVRQQHVAVDAINAMTSAVVLRANQTLDVNSPSKVFDDIGGWLPVGLGNGIKRNAKVAILASANMASGVENAVRNTLEVHSESPKFNNIGEWISTSLGNGIENTKNTLMNTAKDLGIDTGNMSVKGIAEGLGGGEGVVTSTIDSLLDSMNGKKSVTDSAKEMGIDTSSSFADGLVAGAESNSDKASGAYSSMAKDAFQAFKEDVDKRRSYYLITAWEEITLWQEFAGKYAEGTETRLKADQQLARLRYEYSTTWIDKEKYYKRLSLEDELAAWERVQARYQKGHEFRLQAEREIFRLKEEIWQAEYNHSLEYIDDEKYYGRINLSQELDGWKQIVAMTKEGSDERKKADREVFRLENEIRDTNIAYEERLQEIDADRNEKRKRLDEDYYSKSAEITQKMERDIESLNDTYDNAFDSRVKTLYSTYGLFDKVEKPKYVSGFELINNLEDQNTAFDKWQSSIGALAAKGVDDGLIAELREMGPKSLAQINALNRLSDSELDRYVDLWQKKSQEAKDQATFELQGLKEENEYKIAQIVLDTNVKLEEYKTAWENALSEVDDETKIQLDQLEKDWNDSVGTMTTNGITLIQQFKKDWFGEITTIVAGTKTEMEGLKTLIDSFKPMTEAVTVAANKTLNSSINTEDTGKNIVQGVAKGIKKNTPTATKAAVDMGTKVHSDLNSFWMIHSPSRKTIETGMYIVMGLADGLKRYGRLAADQGFGVGRTVLDAMSASMTSVPDLMAQDLDVIRIRPVLDLSGVQTGMQDVNSILRETSGLDLSSTMRLLPETTQPVQNGILTEIKNGLASITNPEIDLNGKLTVEVRNDKGEIIGIAETAIKDLLRRESR